MDCRMPVLSLTPNSSLMPQRRATRRTSDSDWCVLSRSVAKTHSASGSVATVRSMCAAKSASVRVGPTLGATIRPSTTSKLAIKHCVPWRTYSNSRRSTWPGRIGSVGAARSRAWMPVISSVLTTCPPRATSVGASAYVVHTASICAASAAGSRSRGVSQYRLRCGLIAAPSRNQKPPDGAGGDALHDPAFDRLSGQFAGRPLADRAPRVARRLAGQRHDPAELLGREPGGRARARRVRQDPANARRQRPVVPVGLGREQRRRLPGPAPPPGAGGVLRHPDLPPDLLVVRPAGRRQHHPGPPDLLLRARLPPHEPLQHPPLARRERDWLWRWPRHGRTFPASASPTPCPATLPPPINFRRAVLGRCPESTPRRQPCR